MRVIIGLGNPGKKYIYTRHNAGWLILDWLIEDLGLVDTKWEKKFDAEILETPTTPLPSAGPLLGQEGKTLLVRPQTFMNESGRAVKAICDFYKTDIHQDLLIIHDDTELPFATIKTAESSSSAGHNGVEDIINKLGTQEFHRIRIGVEARTSRDEIPTDVFVLQNFTADELKKLKIEVFPKVKLKIEKFLHN